MKQFMGNLEDLFVRATFAEERDFGYLREALVRASEKAGDAFTAVAFAEAGEFEAAAGLLVPPSHKTRRGTGSRPLRPAARRRAGLCPGGA